MYVKRKMLIILTMDLKLFCTQLKEICVKYFLILFKCVELIIKALNNLQCTVSGYGTVTKDSVYKVCDEPHPEKLHEMFQYCARGQVFEAFEIMDNLYKLGYSVDDLMSSMFKIVKLIEVPEVLRLEFIMVKFY